GPWRFESSRAHSRKPRSSGLFRYLGSVGPSVRVRRCAGRGGRGRGAGYNRKQRTGNTGRLPQRRSQGRPAVGQPDPSHGRLPPAQSSETTCRLDEDQKASSVDSTTAAAPRLRRARTRFRWRWRIHVPPGARRYRHVRGRARSAEMVRGAGGGSAPGAPGQPRTPGQRGLAAGNSLMYGQRQLDHPDIGTTERYMVTSSDTCPDRACWRGVPCRSRPPRGPDLLDDVVGRV
ncbi:MAG: hypothetical protein QOF83_4271, partial [Solirubrobacteraceae bacterium]|nr:hypothetical protein [Solirubrobacteraceae bacterium]